MILYCARLPEGSSKWLRTLGEEKKATAVQSSGRKKKKIRGQIIKRIIKVEKRERRKKGACERRQLLGARPLTNSLRFLEGVDRKAFEGQLLGGGVKGEG